jgi:hypothetical protein
MNGFSGDSQCHGLKEILLLVQKKEKKILKIRSLPKSAAYASYEINYVTYITSHGHGLSHHCAPAPVKCVSIGQMCNVTVSKPA